MGRYSPMKLISRFLLALLILPAGLLGQTPAPPVPKGHGLYYQTPKALVPIVGQAVASARAGSPLSAAATFGLKSMKRGQEESGSDRAARHQEYMLDQLQVTLYDFFGYLLPGVVSLAAILIIFWTL